MGNNYPKKVFSSDSNLLEKLPEVKVKYNAYNKIFSEISYTCPFCYQKLWLKYPDGRRNIFCDFCKKIFILEIRRDSQ